MTRRALPLGCDYNSTCPVIGTGSCGLSDGGSALVGQAHGLSPGLTTPVLEDLGRA